MKFNLEPGKLIGLGIGALIGLGASIIRNVAEGAICSASGVEDLDALGNKIWSKTKKDDVIDSEAEEVEE